ncbi:MAG: M56 family metallopeptidase, partial [Thermoguttaceae bacterium]
MSLDAFIFILLRTTLFVLIFGGLTVWFLRKSNNNSFARFCWICVLLSGWVFVPLFPIQIPWFEPDTTQPPTSEFVVLYNVANGVTFDTAETNIKPSISANVVNPVIKKASVSEKFFRVWAAGILGITCFRIVMYLYGLWNVGHAVVAPQKETETWNNLLAASGIKANKIIMLFSDRFGPSLFLTPLGYRLIVPENIWNEFSEEAKKGILLHELEHYTCRDTLQSFFMRILMLPHWFNPIVHYAVRKFDEAAEMRCDQAAFANFRGGKTAFAETLLVLNESVEKYIVFRHAIYGNGLSDRIAAILTPESLKGISTMKKITLSILLVFVWACSMINI